MNRSDTIGALSAALAKAQGEITTARKDKVNPAYKASYADLASIWAACREPLSKNELSIVQTFDADVGRVTVNTILLHSSGEWISSDLSLPLPVETRTTTAQTLGGVITYLRKYSLAAMVGVAPDDDDDGASAPRVEEVGTPIPREMRAPAQKPVDMKTRGSRQHFAWLKEHGVDPQDRDLGHYLVAWALDETGETFTSRADLTAEQWELVNRNLGELQPSAVRELVEDYREKQRFAATTASSDSDADPFADVQEGSGDTTLIDVPVTQGAVGAISR